jgi:hypothetical protein
VTIATRNACKAPSARTAFSNATATTTQHATPCKENAAVYQDGLAPCAPCHVPTKDGVKIAPIYADAITEPIAIPKRETAFVQMVTKEKNVIRSARPVTTEKTATFPAPARTTPIAIPAQVASPTIRQTIMINNITN